MEHIKTGTFSERNSIGEITLSRPDSLNAFNKEMLAEFHEALKMYERDSEIEVIVITGEGDGFSAGGDIQIVRDFIEMEDFERLEVEREKFLPLAKDLFQCSVPVISAVNGAAVGLGIEIALLSDFRISSTEALYGWGFVDVGIMSPLGGLLMLPTYIGLSDAKRLIYTGDIIDAEEAFELGLVDEVVAESELKDEVLNLAEKIVGGPNLTIQASKEGLHKALIQDFESLQNYHTHLQLHCFGTRDAQEGVLAQEKDRNPNFTGK
ncbi:enoyl-CoA hydratase/isomerase family protein [Halopenitus persicus]|uniref:enoyl-CoA hydratase/isomerase family protein n=1 Tax=Halopenitus persicus TaxID=1048396 RepID=UPI000BBABDCD|nr:enoyl-CoA hydratase/isomerase family protein [Halopenitus persicus]